MPINKELTFISMFSGIEAASVAFGPLGWKCLAVSEIDKAASRLLAHHYPNVPNVGDMSKHDWAQYRGKIDIVCGGPPCQAFSVAGLRESLNDARGNLSLVYMKALHAISPRNAIVENVPGWLNTPDNAFGCFLAGLVGADAAIPPPRERKWPDAGMVAGPRGRAAWRILDAQYFGLAQRRERVIVVADFGAGADPSAVLLERVGMQGNFAPSREAGEGTTHATAPSLTASGRGVERSGESRGQDPVVAVGYAPEIARCVATREGSSQDYETTTMVAVHAIQAGATRTNPNSGPDGVGVQADIAYTLEARAEVQAVGVTPINTMIATRHEALGERTGFGIGEEGDPAFTLTKGHSHAVCVTGTISHALTAEGHDASEDGSGRRAPVVQAFREGFNGEVGWTENEGAIAAALTCGGGKPGQSYPAICFTAKDYGGVAAVDIAPTLRAGTHNNSHQNGGVTPAVTVALRGREGGATAELGGSVATALRASSGGGDKPHVLAEVHPTLCREPGGPGSQDWQMHAAVYHTSAVRRLTPRECERLQGFPDDYTRIPIKRYPAKKVTRLRPDDMWELIPNADGIGEWWLMAADGPRYKQLGNSWAVTKFRWLGERIVRFMHVAAANDNLEKSAAA